MKIAILGAIALFLGGSLWRRCTSSEEDRVRRVLDAIEEGFEDQDVGDVMEHIHPAYSDAHGLDKGKLRLFLTRMVFSRRKLTVQRIGRTHVEVAKDRATAHFEAVLSEGLSLQALREAGRYAFEVALERNDRGEWQVIHHRRSRP